MYVVNPRETRSSWLGHSNGEIGDLEVEGLLSTGTKIRVDYTEINYLQL